MTPSRRWFRPIFGGLVLLSSCLLSAHEAQAQAWTPPKGEASLGLSYQNYYTRDHLFSRGESFDGGRIRMNIVTLGIGYSLTDRLAVSAGLPYVEARYDGKAAHEPNPQNSIEDGQYHGTFTDYAFDVRYKLLTNPVVITPFVSASFPSHRYVTFAHSAPGVGLNQYAVGVNLGRRLDGLLPDAYVQARASYTFAQKRLGVSHNRNNFDLELGYFVTPSLGLNAGAYYQRTHGGIDLPLPGTPAAGAFRGSPYFQYHDVIARSEYFNVGGGVSYALTGTVDVTASYLRTTWGKNIHKINSGIAVGFSYSFSPQQAVRKVFSSRHPRVGSAVSPVD